MLESLLILLDGKIYMSTATVANLPINEAVLNSLHSKPTLAKSSENLVNTMCVVVWVYGESYSWYLGYIKKHCEDPEQDSFKVDHLTRVIKSSDTKWKYPSTPDVQVV